MTEGLCGQAGAAGHFGHTQAGQSGSFFAPIASERIATICVESFPVSSPIAPIRSAISAIAVTNAASRTSAAR